MKKNDTSYSYFNDIEKIILNLWFHSKGWCVWASQNWGNLTFILYSFYVVPDDNG